MSYTALRCPRGSGLCTSCERVHFFLVLLVNGTVLDPLGPVAFLFQKCTSYESAASFLHCRLIDVFRLSVLFGLLFALFVCMTSSLKRFCRVVAGVLGRYGVLKPKASSSTKSVSIEFNLFVLNLHVPFQCILF